LAYEDSVKQRQSVSGVNLDEEAANLLRYQQAYQASAQVIRTANEVFNMLIGIVR
jgi:flagellar hook-associated protein 1 FlgK